MSAVPDPRRWKALALLGTAFFMVILDGTIVYVALPSIRQDLDFSVAGVQWVMSAYLLSFGGFLLLGGRAADLLGRRRVFVAGSALFGASSLVCGLVESADGLIAARAVQGISAAIVAPTALSLLMTTFPEGPERNKALGIWAGLGGAGATSGLLLGGPVTQGLGWQWVFFINVPVGLAIVVLSPILLRESRDETRVRTFDVVGAVTITSALVLLVYALSEAPHAGWTSSRTLGILASSGLLVALFGLIEARSRAPLLPLRVLRSRALVGGNLVLFTSGAALDGMLLLATLYAQQVLGYSPLEFGLMTAVMTAMSIVGALTGQALAGKIGVRRVAAAGASLIGVASLVLTRVPADGSYLSDLFVALLIFGLGLGAAFVASQIAALAGVAEDESGLAAGLVDTSFNIGSALGIATVATIAAARTAAELETVGVEEALIEGFQAAFFAAAAFGLIGLVAAVALLGGKATLVETKEAGD